MATAPDSDVIPLKKATKKRLEAVRGGRTFDAIIRDLLDGRHPSTSQPTTKQRDPQEQVALANLAATRWRLAVERGTIIEAGPRLVVWNLPPESEQDGIRYTWVERRGLAP